MDLLNRQPYSSITVSIGKVIIFGTLFIMAATASILLINLILNPGPQMPGYLMVYGVALLYIAAAHLLLRQNRYRAVAYLHILFYMLLATVIVWTWGVNTTIGPLIFTLVIVLAGILLTARCALAAALLSGLVLTVSQAATYLGWHQANTSWMTNQSSFGDVFAYFTVFIMLALISWLYNQEMERSLAHAKEAGTALMHQKTILKTRVKERTAQLRHVQLEEMQHMYRFAELGHLGVTLLHDLANHLTALTLEIESMHSVQYTQTINQVRRIIKYLENIVDDTRGRLNGDTQKQTFNIVRKVSEVITFSRFKASKAGVEIIWQPPAITWNYTADPDSLSQVVAIIANNAIDAYSGDQTSKAKPLNKPRVLVTMERDDTHFIIRMSDWGKGIAKKERKQLFKPTHSAKKSGLGIGLYISKQIIEMQFLGSIRLDPQSDHTEFIIELPRNE